MASRVVVSLICSASLLIGGCAHAPATTGRPPLLSTASQESQPYNLYLPGISGWRNLDRHMLLGLSEGGLADFDHYDWTVADPGLGALLAHRRNQDEARRVAELVSAHVQAHPNARITIITHSAGAGIITWALEKLGPETKIDSIVMLA